MNEAGRKVLRARLWRGVTSGRWPSVEDLARVMWRTGNTATRVMLVLGRRVNRNGKPYRALPGAKIRTGTQY